MSLFEGLPPPAAPSAPPPPPAAAAKAAQSAGKVRRPAPAIRSSSVGEPGKRRDAAPGGKVSKRVRFQSNEVDASEELVSPAMAKITSHIGNPSKFSKASKLAVQLLESGSVTPKTADAFFELLRASMIFPSRANDVKLWADYKVLFTAVLSYRECFDPGQQAQLEVWEIWAVLGNEFWTDDTFVFSKASSRVRQLIDALPEISEEESTMNHVAGYPPSQLECEESNKSSAGESGILTSGEGIVESDPFGLNALIPSLTKKEEKARKRKHDESADLQAQADAAKLRWERREALVACLKLAADQFKLPWAQAIINILVKHAFDAGNKFAVSQRCIVEQVWASVRDQLVARKGNKQASEKLDVTPFERLQSHYAQEHISIRRAVGSAGGRSSEQWLG